MAPAPEETDGPLHGVQRPGLLGTQPPPSLRSPRPIQSAGQGHCRLSQSAVSAHPFPPPTLPMLRKGHSTWAGPAGLPFRLAPSISRRASHYTFLTSPGLQLFLRKLAPSSLRLPPAGQRALPAADFVAPEMSLGRGSFGLKG